MGRTGPIALFVAVALALAAVATGSDALISTHAAKQEAVVARVARMLGVQNNNVSQFYLFQSIVTAYLAYLQSLGQVKLALREGSALWSAD